MEMSKELRNLKPYEIRLLFSIIQKLSVVHDQYTVRRKVLKICYAFLNPISLLHFVWNQDRQVFEHCVFLNMDPADTIAITSFMIRLHIPCRNEESYPAVCQVMPQDQLETRVL